MGWEKTSGYGLTIEQVRAEYILKNEMKKAGFFYKIILTIRNKGKKLMAWNKTSAPQLTLTQLKESQEETKVLTEISQSYMRLALDRALHMLGQLGLISGEENAPTNRINE